MKVIICFLIIFTFCHMPETFGQNNKYSWPTNVAAPTAEKKPKDVGMHGDQRVDNYYWMNDYFKKGPDSDKVVDYLKAENAYLETIMGGTKDLQASLFTEMKNRIKEKDETPPVLHNGYYYYTRLEEGKQYFVYCRKKGSLAAQEEVLADVNKMAEGHSYYSATGFSVSPDNKLMAFGVDTVSRRQYTIHVKNLVTGEIYKDAMWPTTGKAVWANDNKTLFYTETNRSTLLTEKIKKHTLGTSKQQDAVVYQEKDNSNYIDVFKTRSEKYILIRSGATLSTEYRYLDANQPTGTFAVFQPRQKEVIYHVDHQNNKFLISTNWQAKNFRLMETALTKTSQEYLLF